MEYCLLRICAARQASPLADRLFGWLFVLLFLRVPLHRRALSPERRIVSSHQRAPASALFLLLPGVVLNEQFPARRQDGLLPLFDELLPTSANRPEFFGGLARTSSDHPESFDEPALTSADLLEPSDEPALISANL